ncbi:MAG TPA: protein kinase [Steroidobacteraceae bacterium]|nr:protein kinase [Steroidobacteraceae bacterium]
MTEHVAELSGHGLDARYTLVQKLGTGGQGEVWRAHDDIRGVDIALKLLSPGFVSGESTWAALEHEYSIASHLDHPSILKIYPPERSGEAVVLPMELAAGGDLRRLRGAGYLEIIPVLLEVAQALEYAHDHGVVHRDLKPGNVLFDSRGRARLADFGVAAVAATMLDRTLELPSDASLSGGRHGSQFGLSPFTASPEQLRGEAATPADDIYGLGALAYELLSGYPPYYPHFDIRRAVQEPVPPLVPTRQIPALLSSLVTRMLAKDPRERPQSMREVIDDLDAALNDTLTFEFDRSGPLDIASVLASSPTAMVGSGAATTNTSATGARAGLSAQNDYGVTHFENAPPRADVGPGWPNGPDRRAKPDRRSSGDRRASPRGQPPRDTHQADTVARLTPQDEQSAPRERSEPTLRRGVSAPAEQSEPTLRRDASAPGVELSVELEMPPPPSQPAARSTMPEAHSQHAGISEPMTAHPQPAGVSAPMSARPATPWDDIRLDSVPPSSLGRLQPMRPRRWPWVLLGLLAAAAIAVFVILPEYAPDLVPPNISTLLPAAAPASASVTSSPTTAAPAAGSSAQEASQAPAGGEKSEEQRVAALRSTFAGRLSLLESRGAGVWGGRDFAMAKMRAAESVGASDAGNARVALAKLTEAGQLLDSVESRAPQALAAQIAAGEKALASGQQELAGQAFDMARRINPNDRRVFDGQRRARSLSGVLPLLADAENAEAARNFARAVQDYSQALSLDPSNSRARLGLARANAAFGDDNYAKAVGSGFAALGAGRLDEAHDAFEKARAYRPNAPEATEGLRRVGAALAARNFASIRQRAAGLEAEERWEEAQQAYESALASDPSLAFAQQGKNRTAARAELSRGLQDLIDRPDRLASSAVRAEAHSLLAVARAQSQSGPVLRSQIARLEILLPEFDKPVRLSLVSDNATQVAISSIGSFGTFARRDIQLKPGKYTVVGTRSGYRDVRRDITVAPGQETQTISVACSEPI